MASPDALRRWAELLERLEHDVGRLATGTEVPRWEPPADMPALPEEYRERTRMLLASQSELLGRMAQTKAELSRRISALRAVPTTASTERPPVYIDALG